MYSEGIGALGAAYQEERGIGLNGPRAAGALTSSRAGVGRNPHAVVGGTITFQDALTNLADVDRLVNVLAGDVQANPSVTPGFKFQWDAFLAEWKAFFTLHNSAVGRAKMGFSWEGPAQVYSQTEAYRAKLRAMTEAFKREPGGKPTIPEVPNSPIIAPPPPAPSGEAATPFPWKWVLLAVAGSALAFVGWRAYKAGQYASEKKRYLEENVVPAILEARGAGSGSKLLLREDL